MFCRNPWVSLSRETILLGLEAQTVIGLRLLKAVMGGEGAHREAALMITEKAQAMVDAQILLAECALAGQPHLGPSRTVALYRRRVQDNRRRLGQGD